MKKIVLVNLLVGMFISPLIKGQTTYNDVSHLFYANCTYCHHQGGIAPFSLMNFIEASSFSNSIYSAVSKGTMPPWQPDTTYTTSGKTVPHFLNENLLTEVERAAILKWVTDGVLEGDPAMATIPPAYGDVTYRLNGNPDLTLQIPDFRSNATTDLPNPYNCFVVPTNLTEDRWVRAWEIVPGNLEAVHHVVLSIDTTGSEVTDSTGGCLQQGGQFGLSGWTPGSPPIILPSQAPLKTGIRLPAGSNMIIQVHYAPGSGGKVDDTKVRLFLYPEDEVGIREMYSNTLIQEWGFFGGLGAEIPVNFQGSFKATSATSQFLRPHPQQPTTDFSIYSVNPHSHSICTKIKNYAFKDNDTIPIIRIPNWDFNWEGSYFFPNLLKIPTGYTLEADHYFNNSVSNTNLEGPPVATKWGTGTEDEMLFDSFLYLDYLPGDENIDLKAMIESDTLLKVGIRDYAMVELSASVFPNPATDKIGIYLPTPSVYQATLFNITGQVIIGNSNFSQNTDLNLDDIPAGIYILEIVDFKSRNRVCKKIVVTEE